MEVPALFTAERYPAVWQLTSTIEARLPEPSSAGVVDLLRALFPCGSVTGAPKIRTMEIIAALEPAARGVYTGAIGLVRPGGDAVFSVAIRTLVVERETGRQPLENRHQRLSVRLTGRQKSQHLPSILYE